MRPRHVCLVVLLTLLMSATLLGQTLEIREVDFSAIEDVGSAKLSSMAYRVKWTYDGDRNTGDAEQLISRVTYRKPPDRDRTINTWKMAGGTKQIETIEIGNRKFSRVNDGAWSEEADRVPNRYSVYGDRIDHKETRIYLYIGPDVISGVSVKVYERRLTLEYQLKKGSLASENIERIWVTGDGRFAKRESTSITTHNGNKTTSHSVAEYDYDPGIKIEAPIKSKASLRKAN